MCVLIYAPFPYAFVTKQYLTIQRGTAGECAPGRTGSGHSYGQCPPKAEF